MKYYSLDKYNSAILKWQDERAVEFEAKAGRDEEVEDIMKRFELLRPYDTPIYSEKRLKHFFPELKEISEEDYNNLTDTIRMFNIETEALEKEVAAKSDGELQRFVASFATRNRGLLSYGEVSRLVRAFNDLTEDEILSKINNNEQVNEYAESRESLEALYIVLHHTEKTSDTKLVQSMLNLVKGGIDD